MNELIYIYKVRAKLLAWMSAAILLTACSDDDTDRWSGETDFLQIAAYTQDMVTPSSPAATRAVSYPTNYKEYDGSASIGVFMTQPPPPAPDDDKIPEKASYESLRKLLNKLLDTLPQREDPCRPLRPGNP